MYFESKPETALAVLHAVECRGRDHFEGNIRSYRGRIADVDSKEPVEKKKTLIRD